MKAVAAATLQLLVLGSAPLAASEDLTLICKPPKYERTYKILVQPDVGSATILDIEVPQQHGTVKRTDEFYFLSFPKTDDHWAQDIRIDRYTGHFIWLFGDPPLRIGNEDTAHWEGNCELWTGKPKI